MSARSSPLTVYILLYSIDRNTFVLNFLIRNFVDFRSVECQPFVFLFKMEELDLTIVCTWLLLINGLRLSSMFPLTLWNLCTNYKMINLFPFFEVLVVCDKTIILGDLSSSMEFSFTYFMFSPRFLFDKKKTVLST